VPRPSIAHVAIAAFFALVVWPRASVPLIDGDVWWHIRAGLEVLETGRVPAQDSWSIVGAGLPWTSQDWLSNVVLAVLTGGDASGGVGATLASIVYALLVVLAMALLWRALSARGVRGWLGRIAWLSAGALAAGPTLGVRVQVVDLALGALTLLLLWSYLADRRRRWLVGLPLVAVAWANLHAGWVLLFLLGGAIVVGELVDRRLRPGLEGARLDGRQIAELVIALVAAALAIAINPGGLGLYAYPIQTSLIAAHRDFLAEWSPPSLGSIVGQVFAAFVVLGVIPAVAFGWRRTRSADLLVLVGVTVMAASAARFLLVVPIAATVACLALTNGLSGTTFGGTVGRVADRMARPAPSAALGVLNTLLIVVIIAVGTGIVAARVQPGAQRQAIAEHMPVSAVDWMLRNTPGERPFNTYSWGGYLGLRRPSLPVYIDGRSDIYGDAPIREYARAVLLETDPAELFDRREIDHVLFNVGTPLAAWLDDSPQWERAYADELAGVWIRSDQ
jgi:hypothetical protein